MHKRLVTICTIFILGAGLGCGNDNGLITTRTDSGWNVDESDTNTFDTGESDIGMSDVDRADIDDVREDEDTNQPTIRAIADYLRCSSDSDCPVGLGSCVKEVALNRVDTDGTQSVAIGEIFESLQVGEGICTFVCTNNPDVCTTLSVNGTVSDPAPHVCQLVVQGEAPYPEFAPAFPFNTALNPANQAAGQSFGAICRPPFELHADVADSMCTACRGPNSCAGNDSICWSLLNQAPAQANEAGTCLGTCSDDTDCALGFACDAAAEDGQKYCRPTLDTCTVCRDLDGDGFGTGRCGEALDPVTPHDCDDTNPLAYFNPDNMKHPFPAHCGVQDLNCNGVSDDLEQIGAQNYPAEHCTACYDTCGGSVPNGQLACRNLGDLNAPQSVCVAQCERDNNGKMLFADCDGDVTNGCETPTDDVTRQYYRDIDGDGYGDPNDVVFACGDNVAPPGYVNNALDCNDSSAAAHGGPNPPAEICDGLDNNCNGQVDDGLAKVGTACTTDLPGVCSIGTWQCAGVQGFICQPNIEPGTQPEVCDGLDNNCDGQIDENWPQDGTKPGDSSGYQAYYTDNDNDGFTAAGANTPLYACSKPAKYALKSAVDDCNDNNASVKGPSKFYMDKDNDTYGVTTDFITACAPSGNYTATKTGDCNDNNANVHPGATERCNGIDDNCNNQTDEGFDLGATCNVGVGMCANSGVKVCSNDQLTSICSVEPGTPAYETCNSADDNCNNKIDEGCPKNNGNIKTINPILNGSNGGGIMTNDSDYKDEVGEFTCPLGQAMTGAYVYVDSRASYTDIRRISITCRNLTIKKTQSYPDKYASAWAGGSSTLIGGVGSYQSNTNLHTLECPNGDAVYQMKLRHDNHVRWLELSCRGYEFETTSPNSTLGAVHSTIKGGSNSANFSYGLINKGTEHGPFTCQPDEVAVGFYGEADTVGGGNQSMTGLYIKCRKLTFDTVP